MFSEFQKLSVQGLVILVLVVGGCGLAVIDSNFRPAFGDIVKIGLGGYLGQLVPGQKS